MSFPFRPKLYNKETRNLPGKESFHERESFFAAVVRRRRRVLAGYAAAAVLCALLSLLVSVNYDINDYLPPDAPPPPPSM